MYSSLQELYAKIDPLDLSLTSQAQAHLDSLTKPRGSLGRLEELAVRLFCISGGKLPLRADPAVIFTVAADHGVAAEGVSLYPQSVTRQMVHNFLQGGAAINVLCKLNSINQFVVDAGCAGGPFAAHPKLWDLRLGDGTANIARGPAMSLEQCTQALLSGAALVDRALEQGYCCLGIGEMGIANTTVSSALYCAWLGLSPEQSTGMGAGVSPQSFERKLLAVQSALEANSAAVRSQDPLAVLAGLGGFEIALMSGIVLGAASRKTPLVVDGFIATAALLAARKLCPASSDYCFLSHSSAEKAYAVVAQSLQMTAPLLELDLRLGEGTGSAVALPLIRAAAAIYNEMASFSTAGISGAKHE